jgi:hypothetical protein
MDLDLPEFRNLRNLGDQSKGDPGGEIGQRGRGRALAARHISALIGEKGEFAKPGLPGDDLLAPFFKRGGLGNDLDGAVGSFMIWHGCSSIQLSYFIGKNEYPCGAKPRMDIHFFQTNSTILCTISISRCI